MKLVIKLAEGRNDDNEFFIGQHVVDEIVDSQNPACPTQYFNIPIPKGNLLYDSGNKGNIFLEFLSF